VARDDFTLDSRRRLNALLGGTTSSPVLDGYPGSDTISSGSIGSDTEAWRSWLATPAVDGRIPAPPFGLAEPGAPPEPPSDGPVARVVPRFLRGARVDPGRRGAVALVAIALLAGVVVAFLVWGSRPRAEPLTALPVAVAVDSPAPTSAAATVAPPTPEPVVVSVTGKVVRPGLVTVADGARVADVLAAAGGPLPGVDVATLNLARRVADGEQVAVGVPAAADAAPPVAAGPAGGGASTGSAPGAPLDLNTASVSQFDTLPGVGPVTAQRIVDWRTQHGRFARIEQLREVDGIGERRFEQLRELVRI
jgi:competence protein ComEA